MLGMLGMLDILLASGLNYPAPAPSICRCMRCVLQMVLLEKAQGSKSTPVLSYFNSETGFSYVSFGHVSCEGIYRTKKYRNTRRRSSSSVAFLERQRHSL